MRFLSLFVSVLALSQSTSASSSSSASSSNDYLSTVNRAGGWGHADMSLEAGRFEPHLHEWRTMAQPGTPHFTYDPYDMEAGPSFWATNANPQCGGINQSPVPLPAYAKAKPDTTGMLKPITPIYGAQQPASSLSVRNTGHALQIDMPVGQMWLRGGALGDNPYGVVQMHMHAKSEHSVSGAHYPLEIHIVHKDDTRNATTDSRYLAVLGIMVQEGPNENPALKPITDLFVPMNQGLPNFNTSLNIMAATKTIPTGFSLTDLLPTNMDYYHYNGSLTTPPCSEQVVWHVLTTPITASRNQILALTAPFGTVGNARPTQALNGRSIVVSSFQTPTPTPTPTYICKNSASTMTITLAGIVSVIMVLLNMQ